MKIILKNLIIFNINLWQSLKAKKKVTFLINWIYRYNLIYFQSYAHNDITVHVS